MKLKDLLKESGILYKAGVKKYGKEGMTKIQSAAGKGENHEEIGKIKDKYLKGKKTKVTEGDSDTYTWGRINKALMKQGTSPANILRFLSVLNKTNESVNEDAVKSFNDELNGENIKAKTYAATGDGSTIEAQFTKKKWNDGVPVTKELTRGGKKSIKTPRGKFKLIETDKFWYYEINNGWAAVSKKQYSTPPFEF
jgi:hypothetical protein